MVRGLYVAANSLLVQEASQDTIAANLANASTPGYRRAVSSVESFPATLARTGATALPSAQGVPHLTARQTTDFAAGTRQQTDNPCDLAIDGGGFFVVQSAAGEAYTRNGSFTLDSEGYLVTPGGAKLLGAAGPIRVTGHDWTVSDAGDVTCDGAVVDRIRVVDFDRQNAPTRLGDSLFTASAASPTERADAGVRQGYLEGSNVNVVSEMVNMISALRGFETNQKVVQAMDSTLDRAINEVGKV